MSTRRLEDKVGLVPGGASGIGRATALAFAREGSRVVGSDIGEDGGEETVRAMRAEDGEAVFVGADGVRGLTKVAALEYSSRGIRINAVCPGFIETPMVMERGMHPGENREVYEQLTQLHPVGRLGRSEEIADAVVWLCSDGASFVSGHSLVVDGGYVRDQAGTDGGGGPGGRLPYGRPHRQGRGPGGRLPAERGPARGHDRRALQHGGRPREAAPTSRPPGRRSWPVGWGETGWRPPSRS